MKKREANFELLRVLAMFMVILLHYMSRSGSLITLGEPLTPVRLTASLLESFCIVAVNVWVLISGYFLSKGQFRLKRFLQLIAEVYFYTVLISLAMQFVNVYRLNADNGIFKTVQYLFPISSEHYWFATSYVLLYLLSPILNKGVEALGRRQLKGLIFGLLVWFCLIKSFVPVNFPTDDFGYGLKWFICLYLIAAYIRKYDVRILSNGRQSLLLYVCSSLVIFGLTVVLYLINARTGRFEYFFGVMTDYNFVVCLIGALGVFSAFRYYHMPEGRLADVVRFVAPLTFGVYLFHEHLEIRSRWILWMESLFGRVPAGNLVGSFLLHMVLSVLVIYLVGIFIDWIRVICFAFFGRVLGNTKLFAQINKWDEELRQS